MSGPRIDRRTVLTTTGLLAATGLLAGCAQSGGDAQPSNDDESTMTNVAPTTEPATETTSGSTTETQQRDIDRTIDVVARSFEFEPGTAEPIVVQQGETVRICATAEDDGLGTGHGLGILAYGVNLAPLLPGEETCTVFTADEAGDFKMECTVQCSQPGAGSGHDSMIGTFRVQES